MKWFYLLFVNYICVWHLKQYITKIFIIFIIEKNRLDLYIHNVKLSSSMKVILFSTVLGTHIYILKRFNLRFCKIPVCSWQYLFLACFLSSRDYLYVKTLNNLRHFENNGIVFETNILNVYAIKLGKLLH